MAQSFTLSNFLHKTPGELKFGHNIGRIEIYENKFSTSPHSSLLPLGNPKKLTIHTISQSFTLSNFFYKTPGKFKIGHNIGRDEIYENKFSTPFPFVPLAPG